MVRGVGGAVGRSGRLTAASWSLRFDDGVEQALADLDRPIAERVADKLRWLAENAGAVRHKPLRGDLAGLYKLRVGDWRVLYTLLQDEHIILVLRLGHRREVYDE